MSRFNPLKIVAQIVAYGLFAAVVGYFSVSPAYDYMDEGRALIKLNFSHPGQRRVECRRLSPQEIAQLPPNMRKPLDCPRERLPVLVEIELDGKPLFRDTLRPAGIAKDGASSVYRRFVVASGPHRLVARLSDSAREQGFDYEHEAAIELAPGQNFVVDFRARSGGFLFM
jgi:hypothetical protein